MSLFVAGMKGNTQYHMRGVVQFSDGSQFVDADQLFTTGAVPAAQLPAITATTTAGMTPQSGVELLDLVGAGGAATTSPLVITDLDGNVLWSYNPGLAPRAPNPIKLLPNGHFLINFFGSGPDGSNSVLQEVDLAGQLIWQMTATDLNNALAAATCGGDGCNITVLGTHHDFVMLPNGHLIVIAATENTQIVPGTTVIGDVIIDHLFGGRRQPDYFHPAPELAGEGGLRERNGCREYCLEAGLSGRFHAGWGNGADGLVLCAAWPVV